MEEYNDKIKLFPDKFKYTQSTKNFSPNIVDDEFEREYIILLRNFIQNHGPFVATFKHPPNFDPDQQQNENVNNSNNSNQSNDSNQQNNIIRNLERDMEADGNDSGEDHSAEEKELNDVVWDMRRFDVDGNLQKIAGLENNVTNLRRQIFKKDHRIRDLTNVIESENYLRARAEKDRSKYEKEVNALKKKMQNIKTTESGLFMLAKNTLNKDSASRLILKLNEYFVGSGGELLASKKEIIDKQNKKEIDEERRSYLFRIKLAINYYDGKFTFRQIKMVRNAANSDVVVNKRRKFKQIRTYFIFCTFIYYLMQIYGLFFVCYLERGRRRKSKWKCGYSKDSLITAEDAQSLRDLYLDETADGIFKADINCYLDVNGGEYAVFRDAGQVMAEWYMLTINQACTYNYRIHHNLKLPDDQLNR